MTILFTGFDPFGGENTNASFEAVKRLPDEIGGAKIVKAELPTEYARGPQVLKELIETHKPDAVVCVGQAAGRGGITPEKVAINFADARIADNAGFQPQDELLAETGETAYFSTLPVRKIVNALEEAGITASLSLSAGAFVCNCVMYHALAMAKTAKKPFIAGFIHVPLLPSQVKAEKPLPSMELDTIVKGLQIAAEAIAKE